MLVCCLFFVTFFAMWSTFVNTVYIALQIKLVLCVAVSDLGRHATIHIPLFEKHTHILHKFCNTPSPSEKIKSSICILRLLFFGFVKASLTKMDTFYFKITNQHFLLVSCVKHYCCCCSEHSMDLKAKVQRSFLTLETAADKMLIGLNNDVIKPFTKKYVNQRWEWELATCLSAFFCFR